MGVARDRLIGRLKAFPTMPPLDRVCQGGVRVVGRDTCAVVLMSGEGAGSLAASYGPSSGVAADLQFSLGEGPCLAAFRDGTSVFEADLAYATRWPVFGPAAVLEGVRAVTALPLRLGAIRLGVLYLGHGTSGLLPEEALTDAYELARLATHVVLDQQQDGMDPLAGDVAQFEWAHRAVVHQATGMASAQLDVPIDVALSRLRAMAFVQDRSLYELAVDVVDRRVRLTQDSGGNS